MPCESSASLISSPASEASASDLSAPAASKPSRSARSSLTPVPYSPSTGPTSPATTMSAPSQPMLFDETELPSMSSAAGSRARTFHSLENGLALKVRALVCGDSMPASLASYDPASSSWRTSQACFLSEWEPFSETWPRSGTMRRGTAYPLPPLAPLTDEIGSGLLPTPNTMDGMGPRSAEAYERARKVGGCSNLKDYVIHRLPTPTAKANMLAPSMQKWAAHRNLIPTPRPCTDLRSSGANRTEIMRALETWPTPRATDGSHGGRVTPRKSREGGNLIEALSARQFATPTARDWRSEKASQETMDKNSRPLSEQVGGSLNPTWVEWLMGFPLEWTDLGASATRSSLRSPSSSAARSCKRKG